MPEPQSVKTIDEIFEENERVILDNYVGSRELGSWYRDYLYYQHSYSDLDSNILMVFLEESRRIGSLYSLEKAIVPQKVADESAVFVKILSDKLGFLNKELEQRNLRVKKDYDESSMFESQERKELLEAITLEHQERYRVCKRRAFKPSNPESFEKMFQAVKQIASESGSKICYDERYGYSRPFKEDIHTDEQICAIALDFSIRQKMPISIITKDSDIGRLVRSVKLKFKKLPGLDASIYQQLEKTPISVYFIFQGENSILNYCTTNDYFCISQDSPAKSIFSEGEVVLTK